MARATPIKSTSHDLRETPAPMKLKYYFTATVALLMIGTAALGSSQARAAQRNDEQEASAIIMHQDEDHRRLQNSTIPPNTTCDNEFGNVTECLEKEMSFTRAVLCGRCLYDQASILLNSTCETLQNDVCTSLYNKCASCRTCRTKANDLLVCLTADTNCTVDCEKSGASTFAGSFTMGLMVAVSIGSFL